MKSPVTDTVPAQRTGAEAEGAGEFDVRGRFTVTPSQGSEVQSRRWLLSNMVFVVTVCKGTIFLRNLLLWCLRFLQRDDTGGRIRFGIRETGVVHVFPEQAEDTSQQQDQSAPRTTSTEGRSLEMPNIQTSPIVLEVTPPTAIQPEPVLSELILPGQPDLHIGLIVIDGANVLYHKREENADRKINPKHLTTLYNHLQETYPKLRQLVVIPAHMEKYLKSEWKSILRSGRCEFEICSPTRPGANKAPDDDLLVLRIAAVENGIVISNDVFKDYYYEPNALVTDAMRSVISSRVFGYTIRGQSVYMVKDSYGKGRKTLDDLAATSIECSVTGGDSGMEPSSSEMKPDQSDLEFSTAVSLGDTILAHSFQTNFIRHCN